MRERPLPMTDLCWVCGQPATCYGRHHGREEPKTFACDKCCTHIEPPMPLKPGTVLYDRMGRRCVIRSGPVNGRYEVQRGRTLIVWVHERDVAKWTTTLQEQT